jgi:hypothetical protein
MKQFLDWLFFIPRTSGDQSKHRIHSHKYEDMCM